MQKDRLCYYSILQQQTDIVLRMVGLSLLQPMYLQKMQTCGGGGGGGGQRNSGERAAMVKLDRDICRTGYVTIPYSNHSQNIEGGWLVSSSTGVPTENAKSLTPHIRGWGVGGSEIEAK